MSVKKYLEIAEFAKNYNHSKTLNEINNYFGYLHDKDEIDNIGLHLQICIKKSRPMYLHGYVLSSALHKYLTDTNENNILILETGTARGFSSIVMAKILEQHNVEGKIHTIDAVNKFDNCLKAAKLKREITITECLENWKPLAERYINFINGNSQQVLKNLETKLKRIQFAFLDGAHFYRDVKLELDFVKNKQVTGDVIVCDDYTKKQFPGICQAIDEFLDNNLYEHHIFYGNDGTKKRGYVYMKRK